MRGPCVCHVPAVLSRGVISVLSENRERARPVDTSYSGCSKTRWPKDFVSVLLPREKWATPWSATASAAGSGQSCGKSVKNSPVVWVAGSLPLRATMRRRRVTRTSPVTGVNSRAGTACLARTGCGRSSNDERAVLDNPGLSGRAFSGYSLRGRTGSWMPLRSDLFRIRDRGAAPARVFPRRLDGPAQVAALPPVGWLRIRPGAEVSGRDRG